MIPQIIHYCWFGIKKPLIVEKCIKSWMRVMPDYEIKCWDENSFDLESVPFVKQAFEKKKWAFVADYVRLYALYTDGGIYLDTDVYVYKRFDDFLHQVVFFGTETRDATDNPVFAIESGIIGAEKGNNFIHQCMEYYQNRNFILPNGELDLTDMPTVLVCNAEPFGYQRKNSLQKLENNITIYPTTFFINFNNPFDSQVYAFHKGMNSWLPPHGRLYEFCKRQDMMHFYRWIEKIMSILRMRNT
ncbi:glycosyl transferase [Bacteroidia bacterium]|nr:glycosyl transferase [Bacteroidia bacterium]